jgi:hypothetical protein
MSRDSDTSMSCDAKLSRDASTSRHSISCDRMSMSRDASMSRDTGRDEDAARDGESVKARGREGRTRRDGLGIPKGWGAGKGGSGSGRGVPSWLEGALYLYLNSGVSCHLAHSPFRRPSFAFNNDLFSFHSQQSLRPASTSTARLTFLHPHAHTSINDINPRRTRLLPEAAA